MALDFQKIPITFIGGEDSKSNDKLIPPNKFIRMVNARQKNQDTIELRNGYDSLGRTVQNSSGTATLSGGEALNVYNDELLLFNQNQLYSRMDFNERYVSKGSVVPVVAETSSVIRNNFSQTKPDMAHLNGLSVYAWEDSRGGIRAAVIDTSTGNVVVADTSIASSNASRPRVRAVGSYVWIFYVDTSTNILKGVKYDPSSPLAFPSATSLVSSMNANVFYDFAASSDVLCFVAYKSGGSIDVGYMGQTGTIPASGRASTINIAATTIDLSLSVAVDPQNLDVYVLYSTSGGTQANIYSVNLSLISGPTIIDASSYNQAAMFITAGSCDVLCELGGSSSKGFNAASVNVGTDTIAISQHGFQQGQAVTLTTSGTLPTGLAAATTYYVRKVDDNNIKLSTTLSNALSNVVIDITGAGAGNSTVVLSEVVWRRSISKRNITRAGALGTLNTFKKDLILASKAFVANGTWYVHCLFDTDLQGTYFTLDSNGSVISRLYSGQAGSHSDAFTPQVIEQSDGLFVTALPYRNNVFSENNKIISQTGVGCVCLDFESSDRYFADQLGSNLYVAGGFLSNYDGISTTEHGFHLYPQNVLTGAATASGGSMSNGTYQVCFVYAWTDNQGNLHRSAPSVPINEVVNVAASPTNITIAYEVPTLKLTAKTSARANCIIEGYRTANNGTIFRKFTSTTSPTSNDPTVAFVTVNATIDDTTLLTSEVLYTTGNVLENEPPPACKYVAATKNRVALYGTENEDVLVYSKELSPGVGLGFSSFFSTPVDRMGGKPRGLMAMDDKIIIFKERSIFYISGDGPTDLGTNDTFIKPELIASDVGLKDSSSLVLTDVGVMFKSNKGIYLIDRALGMTYIGADVEDYNNLTVKSADLLVDLNEVVFLTDASALVFNYFTKQWYRWENHNGLDAVTWKNKYNYLRASQGIVYQENREKFLDDTSSIQMDVITSWIKLDAIQNFQRVRRNSIVGEYFSQHQLEQQVGYDYNESFPVIQTWDPTTVIEADVFGDDALYGDGSVFGGVVDGVYQVRFHSPVQKCEAIRYRWRNIPQGVSPGKQLSLSNLALEVGVKSGINKMREGKTR